MADVIKCPVCGENNPKEFEFCQYCQSRLQPLTGPLKGADAPITPGQIPTKKATAELEPVLPQWLRDARSSAREAAEGDLPSVTQPKASPRPSSSQDLLAGLRSQAEDEEEETPDWLANITGAAPRTRKPKKDESSKVRWVELGDSKDSAQEADAPSWLQGSTPSESPSAQNDELTDWMRGSSDLPQQPVQPAPADSQDWLRQMSTDDRGALFDDSANTFTPADPSYTPDRLSQMGAADSGTQGNDALFGGSANTFNAAPAASADTPDWLSSLGTADSGTQGDDALFGGSADTFNAAPASLEDTPDWLSSLGAADSGTQGNDALFGGSANTINAAPASLEDTPDWLKGLDSETSSTPTIMPSSSADDDWLGGVQGGGSQQSAQSDPLTDDMPSWLLGASAAASPTIKPQKEDSSLGDVPSWLKAAAPQSSIFDDLPAAQPDTPVGSSDTPDWLNTFKSLDPAPPVQPQPSPTFASDSSSGESTDALFTDMPDWLSGSVETPASSAAPEVTAGSELEAGQLPSWVQAMRPMDMGASNLSASSGDQMLESRGALAGLQGVLPAVPGYEPTSKPRAYSLKLQATDEQLSQAALLEQIIAAETSPVPIASFSTLRTSRGLRWSLAFILFAMVFTVLFLRTPIFSMPVGLPLEVGGAVQVVQSIPGGAPVLVAFDYEPARVGEMEAAAAPMFDQMALRAPRFTFISTNENSTILAERFMITGPMAEHRRNGLQYLNLGYLPGGQMGIRAFAQNPHASTPFDLSFAPAWESAQLQGVSSFSQFTAFILVTDSADSARAWIEQTTFARGSMPVVVISSAQSAPMIQPYFASGQIKGLVSGLQGGAIFEQKNAGRPGTARIYWDAYSIGMLFAMALILGGGLWNLFLGARDRVAAREVK